MSITVEQNKAYSDKSGHFYEGLKREDVQQFTGLESIFGDANKEFARIDSDGDGVLSKNEITAELHKDLKNTKLVKVLNYVAAGASILAGVMLKGGFKSTCYGLIGGLNIASAVYSHDKQNEIEKKLAEQA